MKINTSLVSSPCFISILRSWIRMIVSLDLNGMWRITCHECVPLFLGNVLRSLIYMIALCCSLMFLISFFCQCIRRHGSMGNSSTYVYILEPPTFSSTIHMCHLPNWKRDFILFVLVFGFYSSSSKDCMVSLTQDGVKGKVF